MQAHFSTNCIIYLYKSSTLAANGRTQHFLPSVGKPTPPLKEGEELFPKPPTKALPLSKGECLKSEGVKNREQSKETKLRVSEQEPNLFEFLQ